jgi:hypothetical protein
VELDLGVPLEGRFEQLLGDIESLDVIMRLEILDVAARTTRHIQQSLASRKEVLADNGDQTFNLSLVVLKVVDSVVIAGRL